WRRDTYAEQQTLSVWPRFTVVLHRFWRLGLWRRAPSSLALRNRNTTRGVHHGGELRICLLPGGAAPKSGKRVWPPILCLSADNDPCFNRSTSRGNENEHQQYRGSRTR